MSEQKVTARPTPPRVRWVSRGELANAARSSINHADVILDIGCGLRPQSLVRAKVHVCCEPYEPYALALAKRRELFVINTTAQNLVAQLAPKSVDTVFLLDVIEHIEKGIGNELLLALERVVRNQIVVFTPLGFVAQSYAEGEADGWGYQGGKWQTHRSGWVPKDFDDTWDIIACKDYHLQNGKGEPRDPPDGALWAIKTLSTPCSGQSQVVIDETKTNRVAVVLPLNAGEHQAAICKQLVDYGGAERVIPLSVELSQIGDHVDLSGVLPTLMSDIDVCTTQFDRPYSFGKWIPRFLAGPADYYRSVRAYSLALRKVLTQRQCDVVIAMSGDLYTMPAAAHAANSIGARFCGLISKAHLDELKSRQGVRIAKLLIRPIVNNPTQHIVYSETISPDTVLDFVSLPHR